MKEKETLLRIIVIDDNKEIHNDFIKILTAKTTNELELHKIERQLFDQKKPDKNIQLPKFIIDTAYQGEEGFNKIKQAIAENNPYALAFVDIRMPPGWNGIETIKRIWEVDPEIQIVICTAYSDHSWEETVNELGESDNLLILKKPFDNVAVKQLSLALTKKWKLLQSSRDYTKKLEKQVKDSFRDISKHTNLEAKVQFQATHDTLTGLPNRDILINHIHNLIQQSSKKNKKFALLFLDLDRFKLINDSFGREAGDLLLKTVVSKINSAVPEIDFLSRLGDSEFAGAISNVKSNAQVAKIATKLISIFNSPFSITNHAIKVSPSIGISLYPNHINNASGLLQHADLAMYRAKELGGNQFQFYSADLNSQNLDKLQLESDLHHAIKNNEFFLRFQPQIDLSTNKVTGVEALIRWQHPQKGEISPINFLPLAEEAGLMNLIGCWVLKLACEKNKEWQDTGLPKIRVGVNISAQQLIQPNFVATVKQIVQGSGLKPQYLELELTENIIINSTEASAKIQELRKWGILIALDDFGTGYSSLNHLRVIAVDRLKIDKSFVQNATISRDDEAIIQAIITMAKSLNLNIIAEGVETQEQLDFLKEKHCSEVQGFYFSKPLTADELVNYLKHA